MASPGLGLIGIPVLLLPPLLMPSSVRRLRVNEIRLAIHILQMKDTLEIDGPVRYEECIKGSYRCRRDIDRILGANSIKKGYARKGSGRKGLGYSASSVVASVLHTYHGIPFSLPRGRIGN